MKIHMFPGQGSQYKGMGAELFDQFRDLTERADAILGYSLKELCLQDPRGELHNTRFTQPALYVVNALWHYSRLAHGERPAFVMGNSLGEYNALLAAGCFDFETGLKLVQKRGELMSHASGGGMAAVLNASRDFIESALRSEGLHNVYLANYNTPSQIVLSGLSDEIARAEPLFKTGIMRYYPLATSGAFHTVYMRGAMEQFSAFLKGFTLAEPRIPVIANVTARPYPQGEAAQLLARQIVSTVRWCESIQYLLALAAERGDTVEFEELGPGDVLTKMVYTIRSQTPESVLAQLRQAVAGPAADASTGQETAAVAPTPADKPAPGPQEKVLAWNRAHPVGSRVRSLRAQYDELKTRSEAVVLFGHRAAVYMHGYNGYFDLDELVPA